MTTWLLASAASAADVVLLVPWWKTDTDVDRVVKEAGRLLDAPPAVVAAEQRLGDPRDVVDLLFSQPDAPTPALKPYLLDGLRAEQAAHPEDTLYVAIPYAGREKDLWLWRWDGEHLVRMSR